MSDRIVVCGGECEFFEQDDLTLACFRSATNSVDDFFHAPGDDAVIGLFYRAVELEKEVKQLREYRNHHEFAVRQLSELLGKDLAVIGDLVSEIELMRAHLPDPREASGWDDPGCPADLASVLVELARFRGITPPYHLVTAKEREMKFERFVAAFDIYSDDYLEFENIPECRRLSNRSDLHVMLLLDHLVPGDCDMVSSATCDEIWLQVDAAELAQVITIDQLRDLIRCGVLYDADTESLALNV